VIDACVDVGVKRLIYTSSPSVVFDGVHGILNGTESMAYPIKVLITLLVLTMNLMFCLTIVGTELWL